MAAPAPNVQLVKKIEPAKLRKTVQNLREALLEPDIVAASRRRQVLKAQIARHISRHTEEELLTDTYYNSLKIELDRADHQYFDPICERFPNFCTKFPSIFQNITEHIMSTEDTNKFLDAYENWYEGRINFEQMSRMGMARIEKSMGLKEGDLAKDPRAK